MNNFARDQWILLKSRTYGKRLSARNEKFEKAINDINEMFIKSFKKSWFSSKALS